MKAPHCKLCNTDHYARQPHDFRKVPRIYVATAPAPKVKPKKKARKGK